MLRVLVLICMIRIFVKITLYRSNEGLWTQHIQVLRLMGFSVRHTSFQNYLGVIWIKLWRVSVCLITSLRFSLRKRLQVIQNRITRESNLLNYISHSSLSKFVQLFLIRQIFSPFFFMIHITKFISVWNCAIYPGRDTFKFSSFSCFIDYLLQVFN